MDRFVDRLKRRIVFRDSIRQLPGRWEKVVASDGPYFESLIGNHFLRIKPQILGKTAEAKLYT